VGFKNAKITTPAVESASAALSTPSNDINTGRQYLPFMAAN